MSSSSKCNKNTPKCGLCGSSTKKLTKTPCCNNWICDDADTYVLFSYAKNSCYRNHDRYTLCSHHFTEKHPGNWQGCEKCKTDFDTPTYVTFGTKYNFKVLKNPEKFFISCSNCGVTADSLDVFPLQTLGNNGKHYYCFKEECQEAGFGYSPSSDISASANKTKNQKKTKCGLCGNGSRKALTKTPCCSNWICNDASTNAPFSGSGNGCYRNHKHYTLCSHHFSENHQGSWQMCEKCKADFDTPNYVTFGTKYNFKMLENPEKFSTKCVNCGVTADTLDIFPLQFTKVNCTKFYCFNEECLKAGFAYSRSTVMCLKSTENENKPKCGLCGSSTKKLTKTRCCNNWICDDEDTYVMFSYAKNSCYRNHERYTLCSFHFGEKHKGKWQDCKKCNEIFDTPDYVSMGTKYNFEVLKNPEKYTISCASCGFIADTLDAFYGSTWSPKEEYKKYYCFKEKCKKAGFS